MGTFICGIHPQGAAFENGQLRVGDELLKIHKTVVRGRSHLNVSAIMKKVPNDLAIKVVALRHNSNLEKIAVKKFTQFPVKLDDVVCFKNDSFCKKNQVLNFHLCICRSLTVKNLNASSANVKSRCKKPRRDLVS